MIFAATPPDGFRRGSTGYRRLLIALFSAGIATFAPLYAPQSVLPIIARSTNVGPETAALSISFATGALALGILPWAAIAPRIGRARTISIAVLGASLVSCIVPFTENFTVFLAGRAVAGLLLAAVPAVAVAYLAEQVRAGDIARAAGVYVAGTTVGGLLGRVTTGPLSEWIGWRGAMLAVAAGGCVAALLFALLAPRRPPATAPDSSPAASPSVSPASPASPTGGHPDTVRGFAARVARSFRVSPLPRLYAQPFLLMGVFVALYNYLGFRLEASPFGMPVTTVSLLYFAYLAGTLASARAGALVQRLGFRRTTLLAQAAMILGLCATAATSLPVIITGLIVHTAGFFAAHAAVTAWAPTVSPDRTPEVSATYSLLYYAGSSIIGWAAGLLLSALGWTWLVGALSILIGTAALLITTTPEPGRAGRRQT